MNHHAILILASYEFEGLQLTFKALEHTVDPSVPIIIVLNGVPSSYDGSKVETYSRVWAAKAENRHVVRPIASGRAPIYAIQETINESPILKNIDYILKIDDDLIPLRVGWDKELANVYFEQKRIYGKIGFVTGLINNNCWGFRELLSIFDKWDEYGRLMNHPSKAGLLSERKVAIGDADAGRNGTILNYPAISAWLHEWTSFDIETYVSKTRNEPIKEVSLDLHYSIGCMYSHRSLWTNLQPTRKVTFDELLIHEYCLNNKLRKFAVMSQPMLHLYYHTQRLANAHLMPEFVRHLAVFFDDDSIHKLKLATVQDQLLDFKEQFRLIKEIDIRFGYLEGSLNRIRKIFRPFSF